MSITAYIERSARRSVEAEIKAAPAADRCRYRFKGLPYSDAWRGGRHDFAEAIVAYCSVELGAPASEMPKVRWFKSAGYGEDADYGSENWNGLGFMDSETGDVWIRDDIPNHRLAEIVAHECYHAMKHRERFPAMDSERDALAFGLRVGAKWNLDDYPMNELFAVRKSADLPPRARVGSTAYCLEECALYRSVPRPNDQNPAWLKYESFDTPLPDDYTPRPICLSYRAVSF